MSPDLKEAVELILCQDKSDLADKSARFFATQILRVLKSKERCTVALSGGSTPALLYERLLCPDLAETVPWTKVDFFVSDERCVDHESNESNYGNAQRRLFEPLNLSRGNLHPTENQGQDPEKSAQEYETLIKKLLPERNGVPCFDLIFLGMGPDGHTASLFPDSPALLEESKLVVSNFVEKLDSKRITFTFKLINNAERVIFLVAGKDKAEALKGVLEEKRSVFPSERIKPHNGTLYWFVDRDAAGLLKL